MTTTPTTFELPAGRPTIHTGERLQSPTKFMIIAIIQKRPQTAMLNTITRRTVTRIISRQVWQDKGRMNRSRMVGMERCGPHSNDTIHRTCRMELRVSHPCSRKNGQRYHPNTQCNPKVIPRLTKSIIPNDGKTRKESRCDWQPERRLVLPCTPTEVPPHTMDHTIPQNIHRCQCLRCTPNPQTQILLRPRGHFPKVR